jgi:hypothetical protein
VVGGVEPQRNCHRGAVMIDLRQMDKVKEVGQALSGDRGGTYGPALEASGRRAQLMQRSHAIILLSFRFCGLAGRATCQRCGPAAPGGDTPR